MKLFHRKHIPVFCKDFRIQQRTGLAVEYGKL